VKDTVEEALDKVVRGDKLCNVRLQLLSAAIVRKHCIDMIKASEGDLQTTLVFHQFLITVLKKIGMWAAVLTLMVHCLFQGNNLAIQSETSRNSPSDTPLAGGSCGLRGILWLPLATFPVVLKEASPRPVDVPCDGKIF
jgi:hypothetical protein